MGKYEINDEKDLEMAIKEIVPFPKEGYSKALELVERLRKLAPDTEDKVEYLMDLMKLVNDLLSGDDISARLASTHSKYGTIGLEKLSKISQKEKIQSLHTERLRIQKEIENLQQKREILEEQVATLDNDKKSLVSKTSSLSTEFESLKSNLNDLRENGIKQVNEEIREEKERVMSEVDSLKNQEDVLNIHIEELKLTLREYNQKIANLGNDIEVKWEPPKNKEQFYSLSRETIDEYIESLITEYASKTGTDINTAKQAIIKNSVGLFSVKELLNEGIRFEISNPTIGYIMSYFKTLPHQNCYVEALKKAINSINIPIYVNAINSKKNTEIPNDVDVLFRELYFQKMAANATAKQKIAEAQLNMVLQILQRVLPSEYDINSIIGQIGLTPEILLDENGADELTKKNETTFFSK